MILDSRMTDRIRLMDAALEHLDADIEHRRGVDTAGPSETLAPPSSSLPHHLQSLLRKGQEVRGRGPDSVGRFVSVR